MTDQILTHFGMKQTMRDETRPVPLNVVITSATIDPDVFAKYFSEFSVNVIHVEGDFFSVAIRLIDLITPPSFQAKCIP